MVVSRSEARGLRFERLATVSISAPMNRLLRRFWQPVFLSERLKARRAHTIRRLDEELTIYRGESGKVYLVAGRCAHRRTLLSTGWVQGEEIRCIYHGWKYAGTGKCVERPAEGDLGADVKVAGYPTTEYTGLVFAYLGEGSPPEFDLPRKYEYEDDSVALFSREDRWDCNWLQQIENSLDPVHVSFVHRAGSIGTFGAAVTGDIPELSYKETDAGILQTATRSSTNVRVSDWTFPNNNHIRSPGLSLDDPWIDITAWRVPIDNESTVRFIVYAVPRGDGESQRKVIKRLEGVGDYDPADHHDELFKEGIYPTDDPILKLTNAQDYVAIVGQGAIADRANEWLGKSDAGIVMLRKIFDRELDALDSNKPLKVWKRLKQRSHMPNQAPQESSAQI